MNTFIKTKIVFFLLALSVWSCQESEYSQTISTVKPNQEHLNISPTTAALASTTCEACITGLFLTTDFNWNTVGSVPVSLPNGTTITSTGPSSLSVSKNGTNKLFNAGNNGRVHYYRWGTPANYLAILTVNGGSSGIRSIVLVNTESTDLSTTLISSVTASSTTPLPVINHCAGKGGVIIAKVSNGTSLSASMYRADGGASLCFTGPFVPAGDVLGNTTATKLEILYQGTPRASYTKSDCGTDPPPPPTNCIDCNTGNFITSDFSWLTVGNLPITLPNGTVITHTGASSLSVSKNGVVKSFSALNNGKVHYYKWGTPANFLAILTVNGGTTGLRSLRIVDTNSPGLDTNVILSVTSSSSNPLPIINHCAGKGSAIITKVYNGASSMTATIRTSDKGTLLCSTQPFIPNFSVVGRTTATQLQVVYNNQTIKASYNRSQCP